MTSESGFERKKKIAAFYAAVIGLTVLALTSCNHNKTANSSTAVTDTTAAITSAALVDTNQLNSEWEKFRADADARLKQNDDSIAAIKNKLAKLNQEKKLKYERNIARLQDNNDTLKARLHTFRVESKEKMASFKQKFAKDIDSVYNPLHDPTGWNE